MVLYNFRKIATLATGVLLALAVNSCVTVDKSLGEDYIATNQQYDVYTASFPIEDLRMEQADSLSSYSLYRFSFGSIRDELFGLTTRMTSFTLVPVSDSLDFGIPGTQKFRQFHFAAVSDSVSTDNPSQAHILQNVNVYELDKVKSWLDGLDNLYCIGRNGQHRYNNMDHSMLTAMEAVRNIRGGVGSKENIWNINTEKEYHESK